MGAPYPRTKSFAAAEVADADGIKTTIATSTSPVTFVPADFNGAVLGAGQSVLNPPRTITITRSSAANQYSTNDIVITGTRAGVTFTENIVQPNDDGADTLRGTKAFDALTSIAIPANAGTGGAWTIGVQDICCGKGDNFEGVELHANGTLNVQYGEGSDAPTDAIPVIVAVRPFFEISPTRIRTSTALAVPTAVGLTVYFRQ